MTQRLRSEEGFGLIELLVAMMMLSIGILAILAAFNSGAVAMQRASQVSTASVLADKQMELYRALNYSAIALHTASKTTADANSVYAGDPAWSATQQTITCTGSPLPDQCDAMRTLTGPDQASYRVDTYIVLVSTAGRRDVKRVTVVVRSSSELRTLARLTSVFDQSTG